MDPQRSMYPQRVRQRTGWATSWRSAYLDSLNSVSKIKFEVTNAPFEVTNAPFEATDVVKLISHRNVVKLISHRDVVKLISCRNVVRLISHRNVVKLISRRNVVKPISHRNVAETQKLRIGHQELKIVPKCAPMIPICGDTPRVVETVRLLLV